MGNTFTNPSNSSIASPNFIGLSLSASYASYTFSFARAVSPAFSAVNAPVNTSSAAVLPPAFPISSNALLIDSSKSAFSRTCGLSFNLASSLSSLSGVRTIKASSPIPSSFCSFPNTALTAPFAVPESIFILSTSNALAPLRAFTSAPSKIPFFDFAIIC